MLIDEQAAKLKFCPFGRGAFPMTNPVTGKPITGAAVAGINMAPNGPLTMCEGSVCMLWQTTEIRKVPQELPCPDCGGAKDKVGDCIKCGTKGVYTIEVPHHMGGCTMAAGVGFEAKVLLHDLIVALREHTAAVTGVVRAKTAAPAGDQA